MFMCFDVYASHMIRDMSDYECSLIPEGLPQSEFIVLIFSSFVSLVHTIYLHLRGTNYVLCYSYIFIFWLQPCHLQD